MSGANQDTPHARGNNGKFRSKKLDFAKAVRVCYTHDLDTAEVDELFSASRSIATVATGVDKDEEKEHHLIVALNASSSGKKVSIPVPTSAFEIDDYASVYKANFKPSKHLIKCINKIEDHISVPLNLDSTDIAWLESLNEPLPLENRLSEVHLEVFLFFFEMLCSNSHFDAVNLHDNLDISSVPFALETRFSPDIFNRFAAVTLRYWKDRKRTQTEWNPMPLVKAEEQSFQSSVSRRQSKDLSHAKVDPYFCFRKRELRTCRKTRKSEVSCADKLRCLKNLLEHMMCLFELCIQRDLLKKESLLLDSMIFDRIFQLERWRSRFGIKTSVVLPSTKSIFDVYAAESAISASDLERRKFLSIGSSGNATERKPPTDEGFDSSTNFEERFSPNENFLKFKAAFLQTHSSVLSRHFLEKTPTDHSTHQAMSRTPDRNSMYREVMRKIFQEMERKELLDRNFSDHTLYRRVGDPSVYLFRVNRSLQVIPGEYTADIGLAPDGGSSPSFGEMGSRILGPQDIMSLGNPTVYNLNTHFISCASSLQRSYMCNYLVGSSNLQPPTSAATYSPAKRVHLNGDPASDCSVSGGPSGCLPNSLSPTSRPNSLGAAPPSKGRQSFIEIESHSIPNLSFKKLKKDDSTIVLPVNGTSCSTLSPVQQFSNVVVSDGN